MSDIMNVTVAGGKYTFIMRADYSTTALRYGEPWPAYDVTPPDNLHSALAAEVEDLRDELLRARDELSSAQRTIAAIAFPSGGTQ